MNNKLLPIEQIRLALKDLQINKVAFATNLTYPTIKRILDSNVSELDIKTSTWRKLSDYVINRQIDLR